jgi:hypothetical protein
MGYFLWRRGRDSNPRGNLRPPIDLANRPLQPLGYLSLFSEPHNYTKGGMIRYANTHSPCSMQASARDSLAPEPSATAESVRIPSTDFALIKRLFQNLAEGVGFEPTSPCGLAVFKTAALDQTMRPFRNRGKYSKNLCLRLVLAFFGKNKGIYPACPGIS